MAETVTHSKPTLKTRKDYKLKKKRQTAFTFQSNSQTTLPFGCIVMEAVEVANKQVIFKGFIDGIPKETDMEVKVGTIRLKAPKGSGALLVKNLYLSCDPYMRGRMREFYGSYIPPFVPGQVILWTLHRFLAFFSLVLL